MAGKRNEGMQKRGMTLQNLLERDYFVGVGGDGVHDDQKDHREPIGDACDSLNLIVGSK